MSSLLSGLTALGDAVFQCLTMVFQVYTSVPLLVVAFGIWILYRVLRLFHLL